MPRTVVMCSGVEHLLAIPRALVSVPAPLKGGGEAMALCCNPRMYVGKQDKFKSAYKLHRLLQMNRN